MCDEFECSYISQASLEADEQVSDSAKSAIEVARKSALDKPLFSIFDNIAAFTPPKGADLCSEIDCYLTADVKQADC